MLRGLSRNAHGLPAAFLSELLLRVCGVLLQGGARFDSLPRCFELPPARVLNSPV